MASRTLAGLALFALTVFPLGAPPAGAQAPAPAPAVTPAAAHATPAAALATPVAIPSPISSLPPASQASTLPYPAYGTPVPGVNRGVPVAGVPQIVTLDQAIAIGWAKSPLLASARATVEIDSAPVDLAKTAILPSITGSASSTRDFSQTPTTLKGGGSGAPTPAPVTGYTNNSISATLSELIYDGGRVAAQLREAKATQSAAISTYKRELQTVAYNVANTYYAALASQRTTQVAAETVQLDQVNADLVSAQIAAGTEARSDLLTAELPVAQARVSLVQDQGAELSAQAAFVNAMGLDANTYVLPQDDGNVLAGASGAAQVAVPTYAVAVQRAAMLRPDLGAENYAIASAQAALRYAKLGLFPSLSGGAEYGTASTLPDGTSFRNSGDIGVTLTVPIYDKGATHAQVVQAQGQLDAAQAAFQTAAQGVQLNVKQTLVQLVSAHSVFVETQAELDNARQVLQATQAQYAAGVSTLPLLLNAEVGLTTALAAQVNAVYSLRQAEAAFLYAEGANAPA
jgi:outer membrane protein